MDTSSYIFPPHLYICRLDHQVIQKKKKTPPQRMNVTALLFFVLVGNGRQRNGGDAAKVSNLIKMRWDPSLYLQSVD